MRSQSGCFFRGGGRSVCECGRVCECERVCVCVRVDGRVEPVGVVS